MMPSRLVTYLLCAVLVSSSSCSSVSKFIRNVLPGSDPTDLDEGKPSHSGSECIRSAQSSSHTGVAIKTNVNDTHLLTAEGVFPDITIGSTKFSIDEEGISGALTTGPIPGLDIAGSDLVTAQGQWTDERILVFAGSTTPKISQALEGALTFQGQAYLEYKPANESTVEVNASAQLTIDPDTRLVRLSIFNLHSSIVPFDRLVWTKIAYCDGQFQSTGSGRYRLIAASGRVTNLIGLSADGPVGTAILSGSIFGDKQPTVAALAFTLTGVTGTLLGVATLAETAS